MIGTILRVRLLPAASSCISGIAISFAATSAVAGPPLSASFTGLGDLPGGATISYAYGISGSGDVVAGESFSSISAVHGEGVRWERVAPGTWQMTGIGLPAADALNSPASGASSDGAWVVGRVSYTAPTAPPIDTNAFRWSADTGFEMLGVPRGFVVSAAMGADRHGHVIVGWGGPFPSYADARALVWRHNHGPGWQLEMIEPDYESRAVRIDPVGKVVIGWGASPAATGPLGREAVYWMRAQSGTWQRHWLGALPNTVFQSETSGVARVGSRHLIVGYSGAFDDVLLPVLWRIKDAQLLQKVELPLPAGYTSGSANAISEDGKRIVGGCWNEDFEFNACVWDGSPATGIYSAATLTDLLMDQGVSAASGWFIYAATGVSADGTVICGYANNPDFNDEAWAAELP